ncbi:hypothetical protein ABPG75_002570 [Micractinium tetrahymenae]
MSRRKKTTAYQPFTGTGGLPAGPLGPVAPRGPCGHCAGQAALMTLLSAAAASMGRRGEQHSDPDHWLSTDVLADNNDQHAISSWGMVCGERAMLVADVLQQRRQRQQRRQGV